MDFRFSRGAFRTRSLAGLIRKCGLLHLVTPSLAAKDLEMYQSRELASDDPQCVQFRRQFRREVDIHFIGMWDTVGALGFPGTKFTERGKYAFHDTELSEIVKHAYQALALDEHRAAYDSRLWTTNNGKPKPGQIDVEQRWFIGANANVGGGYGSDPLADLPLAWMQQKAMTAGLKLKEINPSQTAYQSAPCDSYGQFLGGL